MADVEGVDRTVLAMAAFEQAMMPYAAAATFQEAEGIMALSKEQFVPVDFGTLRGTGHVDEPELQGTSIVVRFGFGGPAAAYALAVHENPRAGKTGGVSPKGKPYKHFASVGEWKYLETPTKIATVGMPERIAQRIALQFGRDRVT